MTATRVPPEDIFYEENLEKVLDSRERFTLRLADATTFDQGYEPLFERFGPPGEIERRDLLRRWFDGPVPGPDPEIDVRYHMVLAWDPTGALAGVRDCFVTVDRKARRVVVLLSHVLVLPPARRSGLAALLRAVPIELARRAAAEHGVDDPAITLFGEMETVVPAERDTVIRYVAYGRAGFRAVDPRALAYAQPDFGEFDDLGAPVPLVPVVRLVGHEGRDQLTGDEALAMMRHLRAIHARHCDHEHVAALNGAICQQIDPDGRIPLLRLPSTPRETRRLHPLLRSRVWPSWPEWWQHGVTDADRAADPAADALALDAAWVASEGGAP